MKTEWNIYKQSKHIQIKWNVNKRDIQYENGNGGHHCDPEMAF